MESKFKEPQTEVLSKLSNLPIFSENKSEIIQLDENSNIIKDNPKIQKYQTLAKFGVIAAVIGLIMLSLPFIFKMLTLALGSLVIIGIIALGFIFYPWIKQLSLNYADKLYRQEITRDPINYIRKKANEAHQKKRVFSQSKQKIKQLAENAQIEAAVQSKNVKEHEDRILGLKTRVDEAQALKKLIEENNPDNPYVDPRYEKLEIDIQKLLGDFTITENYRNSASSLSMRYGTKYNEFNNLYKKLNKYDVGLEIYLNKLDSSVKIFEEEMQFVKAGKEATNIAHSIMGLSNDWEASYAANFLTQKIDNDLAVISANIEDIDKIARSKGLDDSSEESIARLNRIAGNITDGESMSVDVSKYNDPNYAPNVEDKIATRSVKNVFGK